jgi:hypothetical protein
MSKLMLFIIALAGFPAFANDEAVAKVLQTCFNNIERGNFAIKYYSEKTGTLVYEVDEQNTIIVKRSTAYALSAADAATCKKIDLGDLDYLGETVLTAMTTGVKPGQNNSKYEVCAVALALLKLPDLARRAENLLKAAEPKADRPATKR